MRNVGGLECLWRRGEELTRRVLHRVDVLISRTRIDARDLARSGRLVDVPGQHVDRRSAGGNGPQRTDRGQQRIATVGPHALHDRNRQLRLVDRVRRCRFPARGGEHVRNARRQMNVVARERAGAAAEHRVGAVHRSDALTIDAAGSGDDAVRRRRAERVS